MSLMGAVLVVDPTTSDPKMLFWGVVNCFSGPLNKMFHKKVTPANTYYQLQSTAIDTRA